MPSGNMLFPVDEDHEAGDCVMQCLAASKKAMHADPRHADGKQYRVPLRAKNLTTYLSGISVMVINGNRSAEVQRRTEKRPLPNPFGDLGVGASPWLALFFACSLEQLDYAGSKVTTQMSCHEVWQVYATRDAIRLLTTDVPLQNKSDPVFTPLYTPVQIYRVTVLPRVRYIYFPYAFARAENPWKL